MVPMIAFKNNCLFRKTIFLKTKKSQDLTLKPHSEDEAAQFNMIVCEMKLPFATQTYKTSTILKSVLTQKIEASLHIQS
jgi:hypothetical protein